MHIYKERRIGNSWRHSCYC